ncbi:zinc/manganese transport system permease protein [Thiogranum longum]|uniref:Zinc/manganese transport system permease protein n=1 Tax=Thiogranum longum TaxID=1537524 RepID=A0A4R1H7D7_9GAMM|nr:metal ABC transporter permease [Thiogranum longum]TCK17734.1 zinc/manganese transport system permease protein [Thiogranum longum]
MMQALVDLDVIVMPMLAGVLVIATHVPLGREVLQRGIIFIDLAVAQIAGLGVIAAGVMGWEVGGWATQAVAAGSALLGAILIRGFERYWPETQEALIGITFAMAATGGLLLLSGNPHGAEHVADLLTGQLLWVDIDQLRLVALVYLPVLVLWYWLGPGRLRFYLLFAVTVTASVQLVGVYLVFSSLIIPAVAVRRLQGLPAVVAGTLLGVLGYAGGLVCSLKFDWPAGPTVVWMLAITGLLSGAVIARFQSRRMPA